MKHKLFILLLFAPTLLFAKKVINSGHQTPVKYIEYLENENTFFSLSEDGTLVIKKSMEDKISRRFFLTSNNITNMILSPKYSQLAIVETDSASQFIVSVWDWKSERKLYSINLKEFPMSIGFTGSGNYIFVTSISNIPVKVFNAKTGASTSFLGKYSSFIDYMYVGSSEKYAFLYSSSGTLDIVGLKDSKVLKKIETVKNLTNIQLTPDKAYLVGQNGETIYIIGRNNGKVIDKTTIKDLSFFEINRTTGEVACYIDNRYKKSIHIRQIFNGRLFESEAEEVLIKSPLTSLSLAYNTLIYSDLKGDLHKYDRWEDNSEVFVKNSIEDIETMTIIDDTAVLTTNDKIYLFQSKYFSDKVKNTRKLSSFSLNNFDSPIINPTGSMEYKGNLLLWNNDLVLLDIKTGETIFRYDFSADIIDIKIKDDKLLALDNNGLVQIINLADSTLSFSFKSPGFTSIGFYSENEIIGGVVSASGDSLILLDIDTKETIPLKTTLNAVFNIIHAKKSYVVYLAGLKSGDKGNETHFIEYNLVTRREKTLLRKENEVLNSGFVVDNSSSIFTNLGTKSLLKINQGTNRIKSFQDTTNQTKHILYKSNGLYTINENKSLSIWHPSSGEKIIDFYLFFDSEWVAMSSDSTTAFGSPGAKKYISSN